MIALFRSDEGGFLLVDKPAGWTSFDVVKKIRSALRVKKVGHAGTLDPLATGLLILASQRSTARIDTVQSAAKQYAGTMVLGGVTASFDADTPVIRTLPFDAVTAEQCTGAAAALTGAIMQQPPMYSALKQNGRRLYTLARKGVTVERPLRPVTVDAFEILDITLPVLRFRVHCSKGTYVRSLVHDFGQALGCGAYIASLRRTAIGPWSVDDALGIDDILRIAGCVPVTETAP